MVQSIPASATPGCAFLRRLSTRRQRRYQATSGHAPRPACLPAASGPARSRARARRPGTNGRLARPYGPCPRHAACNAHGWRPCTDPPRPRPVCLPVTRPAANARSGPAAGALARPSGGGPSAAPRQRPRLTAGGQRQRPRTASGLRSSACGLALRTTAPVPVLTPVALCPVHCEHGEAAGDTAQERRFFFCPQQSKPSVRGMGFG